MLTADGRCANDVETQREIATVLHVMVGAPFCERESVVPSDAVFISGHTLENPKNAPLCLTFSQAQYPLDEAASPRDGGSGLGGLC
jgi:hypothetical protein